MNQVITKLTSGRFILTCCAGAAFLISIAMDRPLLPEYVQLITMTFILYFKRDR